MSLKQQQILLTGSSRGIGAAIARECLIQGAVIAAHYNREGAAAQALLKEFPGTNSVVLQADLEDPQEAESLWDQAENQMGHIDALVVNAGVFLPHSPESSVDEWWKVWRKTLSVNLDAAGMLTKKALDHFRSRGGGRILYIGSRAAFRGETEDYLAYAASKGGLTSLARSVARGYGAYGVKAFTIAPGFTNTEMAAAFLQGTDASALASETALKSLTQPEDIAPLAAFILSGQMDHATGTTIDVNGGSYMH